MNLSVDPGAVALYNNSPVTQLSKYAPVAINTTEASNHQNSSKKGLMRRALRRRKRGRLQAQKNQTQKKPAQSVKPKSSWQTQSLGVLIAGLREKREKEKARQSISSWDESDNSTASIINESSSISSEDQELSAAPKSPLHGDHWDAQTVESEEVREDDCHSCHSDGSSVVVWRSFRIERQKALPVVDRQLKNSDGSPLVTKPISSAELIQNAFAKKENLPKRDVKSRQWAKGHVGGRRRPGNFASSSGKNNEEVALNLMLNDTFLLYQTKVRASQIESASKIL